MSIFGSFYSGLSGLSTHSTALNVVGSNLANINTVGYKSSSISFQDVLAVQLSSGGINGAGNPMQVGLGALPSSIDPLFSQGSIQTTNEITNMAIQGRGFFILENNDGRMYSRAGNFSFNAEGYLVNPIGANVLGWTTLNADGTAIDTSGDIGAIKIDQGVTDPPEATEILRFVGNLDSNAAVGDTFQTSIQIYDSLGDTHTVTIQFTNTSPGNWSYQISTEDGGATITGGGDGSGGGTISFDPNGVLTSVDGANPPTDISFGVTGWSNGAADSNLTWDLVDPDTGTVNTTYLTGYASPSTTSTSYQDGWGVGQIRSILVNTDGVISGIFSNGRSRPLGQVALATFNNDKGLVSVGENMWASSDGSGIPTVGTAGTGGRGDIIGNSLELSNVDIAEEFTKMIVYQRGYQANSRIITTTDSLIQEALNIKR
jgi:flagellar hook protein FlgE